MKQILGIDPGLNTTGYGILHQSNRGPQLVEAGVIRGGARGELPTRLAKIHEGLADVISLYQPTELRTRGTLLALPTSADSDLDGACPRRDLLGGGTGRYSRSALLGNSGEEDFDG